MWSSPDRTPQGKKVRRTSAGARGKHLRGDVSGRVLSFIVRFNCSCLTFCGACSMAKLEGTGGDTP